MLKTVMTFEHSVWSLELLSAIHHAYIAEKTMTLKMGGQRWSDIHVVFTKTLCGRNFCVWYVTKLKFTRQLQVASLSLHLQFETNLMSNSKVIKLLLQLKSEKAPKVNTT